jgi:hypothetical protein
VTDLPMTANVSTPPRRMQRLGLALVLVMAALAPGDLGAVTRTEISGAFTSVAAFVAATLLIFYSAERLFGFDTAAIMSRARHWQVPLAALLGVTPGCGGAVMVVAAYSSGKVGFGAMVATLTATMGDAAFLLLATRPDAALVLLPMQFTAAVLTGWLVDRFIKADYRPTDVLGLPAEALALTGAAIGLGIWVASPVKAMTHAEDPAVTRMAEETSFITVWVVLAFLLYAYLEKFAGLDLAVLFGEIAILLPLIGALIGLIPGCGPQILVTSLFIGGAVPFSALVANAISNDGDALFPAIALTPRAAILATLWSLLPALILGYGFHFLAPGLLSGG